MGDPKMEIGRGSGGWRVARREGPLHPLGLAAPGGRRYRGYRGLVILLVIGALAGVKVWIWGSLFGKTLGPVPPILQTRAAAAQTGPRRAAEKAPVKKPDPAAAQPDKKPKGDAPGLEKGAKGAGAGTARKPGENGEAKAGPARLSSADADLIQALRAKEAELQRRELRLRQEEGRLERLRRDIERKVEELRGIREKIESYVVQGKKISEERLKRLAKVYESAPPERAGVLLSELDPSLAALILVRIDGRKAGRIWGFVDQGKAVRISKEMTKLR